jgi:hypothetical protein
MLRQTSSASTGRTIRGYRDNSVTKVGVFGYFFEKLKKFGFAPENIGDRG